ncbi:sugar ABC transporter substrate-binding protein [Spirochaeta africana]|uniref:ABC-type xylose transport system, periplasmic component n=1 Tax=Spirochaeta africana (strain ATCC 700263 / DSM 8902 / Z-7692) TaxID=889378 RepID=H9UFT9_SPIAZ|nr:substrate-binding domain-containing protein [Spirochaeta africana]AFG36382.1 ABC-type xylose transport system, periplasmic component [Spirochaeta africana DSM 8902]
MNKRFALVAGIIALSMIIPATQVFAAGQGEREVSQQLVVGLSLPTQREERWVRDRETMIAEAEAAGIDLRVAVADADMAQQASQVENLLAQGIQVLILAPHDAQAAASLVEEAAADGVPVISYDRLILSQDVDVYLSFDNERVGELQGEFITNLVPSGNYIVMSGAPTDNNAALFKRGAMKYIQPLADAGDINIVTERAVDNWLPENALNIVENALTASNNQIDAILAPNDGTAGGAIQALSAQGMAGQVPITGQDAELSAVRRIVEGTQSMTIFKDTRELGKAAIEAAIILAQGGNVETNNVVEGVPSLLLTPHIITEDNIDLLIDSGYLTRAQIFN